MPALAQLLDSDQAAALTGLQAALVAQPPPPPAAPGTSAACPTCGQARPVPAATFRAPGD
jgi:hypothetical protein